MQILRKLWFYKECEQEGFTLIELMIVVSIIGILAAIAIPNFVRYQLRSKTAEGKQNIGVIRISEETFSAEYDCYLQCGPMPTAAKETKQKWAQTTGRGFDVIGFAPSGNVYYSYGVVASANKPVVSLSAAGNDSIPSWAVNSGIIGNGVARVTNSTDIWVNAMGDLDGDRNPGGFAQSDENVGTQDLAAGEY